MPKSGTGSVSRALKHAEKWENDPEFRKRNRARGFQYYHRKVGALQERDRILGIIDNSIKEDYQYWKLQFTKAKNKEEKESIGAILNYMVILKVEIKETINGLT